MLLEKTHTFEDLEVTFEMSFEVQEAEPDVGLFGASVEDLCVDSIVVMGTRFKIDRGMSKELSDFIDKSYEADAMEQASEDYDDSGPED